MESISPIIQSASFPVVDPSAEINTQFLQDLKNAAVAVIQEHATTEDLQTNIQILKNAQTKLEINNDSSLGNVRDSLHALISGIDQHVDINTLKELANPLLETLQPLVGDSASMNAIQGLENIIAAGPIGSAKEIVDCLISNIGSANAKISDLPDPVHLFKKMPVAYYSAKDRNEGYATSIAGKDNVMALNDLLYSIDVNIRSLEEIDIPSSSPEIIEKRQDLSTLYKTLNLAGKESSRTYALIFSQELIKLGVDQLMQIFNYRYQGGDDDGTQLLNSAKALLAVFPPPNVMVEHA